jgi:ArsR family transcriptional regulator, arsenate/arsenite/antimonite-responsive transcriptional repressor / arsenate reductase (thioredoxin)
MTIDLPESAAVAALSALANPTRLAAFRRLVEAGPNGMPAGEAARLLNVPHNTLSGHLGELVGAGLVRSRRDGRSVIYSADLDGLARLVAFLAADCCGGNPETCDESHPLLARIAAIARGGEPLMSEARPYNVLILCTGNSARSILAEAILNKLGVGRFKAFSAGSQPKGDVHPEARALLTQLGYDVSWARSKSWDEFGKPDAPHMDFVVTVCDSAAGESCPVWPGHPMTAHWGVEDPAAATGSPAEIRAAFAEAYRLLYNRISIFVSLPIGSLDRLALQGKLHEIGAMEGATGKARIPRDAAE